MEERRLNLNSPLLSVRRNLSSASLSSSKGRKAENSRPRNPETMLASRNVGRSVDQVTKPVSVPFTWEQVPGKAKDVGEHELLPSEETTPATPVISARNSMSVRDDCSEEFREIPQVEKGPVSDEDDRYSDALDTLSPTGSFSIGFSVSGLSGSDGRSGMFSVDTGTRDFIMGRFLPAARAMASESSLHRNSKNQHLLLTEQPHDVEKPQVSAIENRTPSRQHNMEIVQYFTQALPQAESSEEEEDIKEAAAANNDRGQYKSVPAKGCGLLPQLCLRSSLRLLNPVPGLKSRIKNSMPFIPAIRKDLKDESNGQSVENFHLPILHVQSGGPRLELERVQIKPLGGSNQVTFSGDLRKMGRDQVNFSGDLRKMGRLSPFRSRRNDVPTSKKSESPHPAYVVPHLGGSRQVNLSGELRPMARKTSPFRSSRNDDVILEKNESPRTSHVMMPPFRGSGRVNFSGELRSTGGLSPFRPPRSDVASSWVNFSGELRTTGRLSPFRPSRNDTAATEMKGLSQTSYVVPTLGGLARHNFSGELRTTGQLSPFRRELSQPSYVVPPVGLSSQCNFSDKLQNQRRPSPLRPQRNDSMCTTLQKNECMPLSSPTFERTLYADRVTTGRNSCSDSNSNSNSLNCEAWMDPVAEEIATREVECLKFVSRDKTPKEVENGVLDPSLPIPSLRSPSQSWLLHTLPSVGAARSRFPSPQKTPPLSSTKHNSDTRRADAKWETIVKTSQTYHDHTRYSEELTEHVSSQCKS